MNSSIVVTDLPEGAVPLVRFGRGEDRAFVTSGSDGKPVRVRPARGAVGMLFELSSHDQAVMRMKFVKLLFGIVAASGREGTAHVFVRSSEKYGAVHAVSGSPVLLHSFESAIVFAEDEKDEGEVLLHPHSWIPRMAEDNQDMRRVLSDLLFRFPDRICDSPDENAPTRLCKSQASRWYLLDGDIVSRCDRHRVRASDKVCKQVSYEEALVYAVLES